MLLNATRILAALSAELRKLQSTLSDRDVEASTSNAIANALQLLRNRQQGDIGAIHSQLDRFERLLSEIGALLGSDSGLRELASQAARIRALQGLSQPEESWRTLLAHFQQLMIQLTTSALPSASKISISRAVVAWQAADLLGEGAPSSESQPNPESVEIDRSNLATYLRDRFDEPGLQVTALQPLAGGFGKQTLLFEVEGRALSGVFVMRRDIGKRASVPNDCHLVRQEYRVVEAAFARSFPAPVALWLDTEHQLLPGGDFTVMRRSPGKLAGDFFGARTTVPVGLVDALADVTARLHTLGPLPELGDLTDSIRGELWGLSQGECTERYVRNWFELFLREDHTPSPALVGLYSWLLDNVPQRAGKPVLLHGDIGFHNFLFDGDKLSAVLDWEFAHIGDPAEELGYIKVTVGAALDWDRLLARYCAAGGTPVDAATLRYFQVWAYVRNATAANLISTLFDNGQADDLKLTILPVAHIPHFILGAQALIDGA